MTDDPYARIAELEAESAALRERERALASALAASDEQQTATAEVLRVVAASPGRDLRATLRDLQMRAIRLLDAGGGGIFRLDGDVLRRVTSHEAGEADQGWIERPLDRRTISARAVLDRRVQHIHDVTDMAEAGDVLPESQALRARTGARTFLAVPLLKGHVAIGVIFVARYTVRPFTDREITLMETFADQAVIAIENARLFEELEESNRQVTAALERQTATAEVLEVIASAPTDLERVLQTIIETAARLCDAPSGALVQYRERDGRLAPRATAGHARAMGIREGYTFDGAVGTTISPTSGVGRAYLQRETLHIADMAEASLSEYPDSREIYEQIGHRTVVYVPLLRHGDPIGVLAMQRLEVNPFTEDQIALLETFADQAVIAMENTRLFQELEQRNADLTDSNRRVTEALEQQIATAEVLRVIASSPTDAQPVLDALVAAAGRLLASDFVVLHRPEDDHLRTVAVYGAQAERFLRAVRSAGTSPPSANRDGIAGRAFVDRRVVHVPDAVSAVHTEFPASRAGVEVGGQRAQLAAPLLRGGEAIGVLSALRFEPGPFTDDQVRLIQSFADQAVIAIENARLFQQLEQRNLELSKALERQTATAEVLRVIASSPTEMQRVLDAITESAARLCGASNGAIWRVDGDDLVVVTAHGLKVQDTVGWRLPIDHESVAGWCVQNRQPMRVDDLQGPEGDLVPRLQVLGRRVGYRSIMCIPLMSYGEPLGVFSLFREAVPFSGQEAEVVQSFADQAVIAIENARLFSELQDANHQVAEASRHKSNFLANMSHELRTPLNAIIGYSEMLQEEAEEIGEEAFIPDLQKVNAAGKHLLGLINDILDLSKIEAGRMDLYLETFEVGQLVRDVQAIVQPLIEKNSNALAVVCPSDIGTTHADLTKVRQTLFNLLSNAAKFTDHGTITLTVERESDDWITFAIADTGIGMTETQLGRLFEAFSQAEASTRSKYGGTGLGLAISRHFCRLMGGDLTVESIHGQGSTFSVRLPARVAEPTAQTSE